MLPFTSVVRMSNCTVSHTHIVRWQAILIHICAQDDALNDRKPSETIRIIVSKCTHILRTSPLSFLQETPPVLHTRNANPPAHCFPPRISAHKQWCEVHSSYDAPRARSPTRPGSFRVLRAPSLPPTSAHLAQFECLAGVVFAPT